MLRRSWETKKNIIKELNNRLNENRIISEQEQTNLEKLKSLAVKGDRYKYNFFNNLKDKEFVNGLSQNVLDTYYGLSKSSCGVGTNTPKLLKSISNIKNRNELLELGIALRKKPICLDYETLDDVLNGELGAYDKRTLDTIKKHFEDNNIATLNYGLSSRGYWKQGTIEIVLGEEPETEEPETEEPEKEEKIEKKKGYKKVDSIVTLEDIVNKEKIIKKGNSGGIVEVIQQSLLDLKYDIGGTEPDGKFGLKTKSAVMKFQEDNNLTVDGIVGPKTAQKMIDKLPSGLEKLLTNDEIKGLKEKTKTTLKDDNLSPEQKQNKIKKDLKKAGVNINLDTNIDFSSLTKLKKPKEIEDKVDLVFNKFGTIPVGEYDRNLQSESEISKPILDMMKRMNIIK